MPVIPGPLPLHTLQGQAFSTVPYTTEQLQRYIRLARSIKPTITPAAAERLVSPGMATSHL